jgi:hypothetical protein
LIKILILRKTIAIFILLLSIQLGYGKAMLTNISWVKKNENGKFEKLFHFDKSGSFLLFEMYPDGTGFYKMHQGTFTLNDYNELVLNYDLRITLDRRTMELQQQTKEDQLVAGKFIISEIENKIILNKTEVFEKSDNNMFVGVWKAQMKNRLNELLLMEESGLFVQITFGVDGLFKTIKTGNWMLDSNNKIAFELDFKGDKLRANTWKVFDKDLLMDDNKTLMAFFDPIQLNFIFNTQKLNR